MNIFGYQFVVVQNFLCQFRTVIFCLILNTFEAKSYEIHQNPPQKTCCLTCRELQVSYQMRWRQAEMSLFTVWPVYPGDFILNVNLPIYLSCPFSLCGWSIQVILSSMTFFCNVSFVLCNVLKQMYSIAKQSIMLRSASFILAYLISSYNLTLQQVLQLY